MSEMPVCLSDSVADESPSCVVNGDTAAVSVASAEATKDIELSQQNDQATAVDTGREAQPAVVGGAGDAQSSCDWSIDETEYHARIFGEESSQGIEADDEEDASSSSDEEWQEVEGTLINL